MGTNVICFMLGAIVGVLLMCFCSVSSDDSRAREEEELKKDIDKFELDEDLKEVTEE